MVGEGKAAGGVRNDLIQVDVEEGLGVRVVGGGVGWVDGRH